MNQSVSPACRLTYLNVNSLAKPPFAPEPFEDRFLVFLPPSLSLSSSDSTVAELFFALSPLFATLPRLLVPPVLVERPLISLESLRANSASACSCFVPFFDFFTGGGLPSSPVKSSWGVSSFSSCFGFREPGFDSSTASSASGLTSPLTLSNTFAMTLSTAFLFSFRKSAVRLGSSSRSCRLTRFALIVDKSVPGADRI